MISRRRFLQSSLAAALVPMLPRVAVSADLRVRQSWDVFRTGPTYASFCYAIEQMRANKDATTPAGWAFWADVHRYHCPHGKPYFLAWHRGLLFRFEAWLRKVSGDPNLVLPYWNYYADSAVPAEFLDPSSSLYRGDRTGTDVYGALSLDPFADTIIHFPRGATDAFEPTVESRPHNPVHNLIGGIMSSIAWSPKDPLFFVHHANIDRLWAAWIKAGDGRRQPAASNTYWQGDLDYGTGLKAVPRVWTTNTYSYLGYQYDDETMPAALPPEPAPPPSSSTTLATATAVGPSLTMAGAVPVRPASVQTVPLGSHQPLVLDERSVSVDVSLTAQDANRVRSLMLQPSTATATTNDTGPVCVVLDGVTLTGLGVKGGYFYKVFINLPEQGVAGRSERSYLLGMIGPFEISVARMQAAMQHQGAHGMQDMAAADGGAARLVFPATEALRRIWPTSLDKLTVSFVRVDGRAQPTRGQVIKVKDFSVQTEPSA